MVSEITLLFPDIFLYYFFCLNKLMKFLLFINFSLQHYSSLLFLHLNDFAITFIAFFLFHWLCSVALFQNEINIISIFFWWMYIRLLLFFTNSALTVHNKFKLQYFHFSLVLLFYDFCKDFLCNSRLFL